ncbi:hypothetical protein WNB94_08310 [Aquabacterium sp. A3]|uniref:hypothetical protein n=1 Tax=Aquabacterium sp. A3 TaxID=3132829 RepID=UPI0031195E6E
MPVIVVANPRGGVGKSMLLSNIAGFNLTVIAFEDKVSPPTMVGQTTASDEAVATNHPSNAESSTA